MFLLTLTLILIVKDVKQNISYIDYTWSASDKRQINFRKLPLASEPNGKVGIMSVRDIC